MDTRGHEAHNTRLIHNVKTPDDPSRYNLACIDICFFFTLNRKILRALGLKMLILNYLCLTPFTNALNGRGFKRFSSIANVLVSYGHSPGARAARLLGSRMPLLALR